jgi:hypothetical protein
MSFDTETKLAIYRHFAETGQRPSLQVVAERVGADVSSVREAYVRLRTQRVFRRPGAGTTLFSPEATCFSSGRKNGFVSGAPRMIIPCGRSSQWTSYGRSRRSDILTRRSFGEGGSTRLQDNSRRPQPDEMRSIFAGLGLGGDFWDPQSDIFG